MHVLPVNLQIKASLVLEKDHYENLYLLYRLIKTFFNGCVGGGAVALSGCVGVCVCVWCSSLSHHTNHVCIQEEVFTEDYPAKAKESRTKDLQTFFCMITKVRLTRAATPDIYLFLLHGRKVCMSECGNVISTFPTPER